MVVDSPGSSRSRGASVAKFELPSSDGSVALESCISPLAANSSYHF